MTARLFTLDPVEGFRTKTFAGHRAVVLSAYFFLCRWQHSKFRTVLFQPYS